MMFNRSDKIPPIQLVETLSNLSALLEAGFPLSEAIDECREQAEHRLLKLILERIGNMIKAGESLSRALALEPAIPQIVTALVRTGENTGTLAANLLEAAEILEQRRKNRQNLVAALTYPAIVIVLTLVAAIFLATAIAPQIADMYERLNQPLPMLTRLVIYGGYAGLVALVMMSMLVIFTGTVTRGRSIFQRITDGLMIIPILDRVNSLNQTALWTFNLGILLRHKIPVAEALTLVSQESPDVQIRSKLTDATNKIMAGSSPAEAFKEMDRIPPIAARILAAGDRSGNLPDACQRVHKILSTRYKSQVQKVITFAEPIAVIVAGAFVLLIALSVMLPIAELGGLL